VSAAFVTIFRVPTSIKILKCVHGSKGILTVNVTTMMRGRFVHRLQMNRGLKHA